MLIIVFNFTLVLCGSFVYNKHKLVTGITVSYYNKF